MKIGISTSVIQRGQTGIGQYLFALLRAFAAASTKTQFALFVLEQDLALFDFAAPHMQIIPVAEKFRPAAKNIFWHQTELPKLIRQYKIDLLHVPSYRRMLWPKPCPLVATIHDLAPFHVPKKYDWKRMLYGKIIVKQLAKRQDEIIAVSRNTAEDIIHFFGVLPEKITVIHNGLDHARFFPGSRDEAKKWIARHQINAPFFLYVARLEHPGKNHVRLIQAFNDFKAETKSDWKLVLGGSDWSGSEIIHAKIQQSNFSHDIHSLGFVSNDDLPMLYRAADIFIYPSLYEGFGMPPLEAMACGCPVISSPRGSLGEVVGTAAQIIDPENISQLKTEMTRLANDPAAREKLREAGLQQAQLFHWQKTAEATLKIYARALEKIGRPK
ncbi:MAG: glycosyltransferase family 4 protein [Verrucomicrobiota bacterium]|nr:glycosyltransferase family 4 protein [Verrucomicrobiota bacterium]